MLDSLAGFLQLSTQSAHDNYRLNFNRFVLRLIRLLGEAGKNESLSIYVTTDSLVYSLLCLAYKIIPEEKTRVLATLNTKTQTLARENATQNQLIADYKLEVNHWSKKYESTLTRLSRADETISDLKKKLEDCLDSNQKFKLSCSIYEIESAQLLEQIETLTTELTLERKTNVDNEEQLFLFHPPATRGNSQKIIEELNKSNALLRGNITAFKQDALLSNKNKDWELESLRLQLQEATESLGETKHELLNKTDNEDVLNLKFKELEHKLAEESKENDRTHLGHIQAQADELKNKNDIIEQLRAEKVQFENASHLLIVEKKHLQDKYVTLRESSEQCQNELQNASKNYEERLREKESFIAELQREIENKYITADQYVFKLKSDQNEQVQGFLEKISSLDSEILRHKDAINDLRSVVRITNSKLQTADNTIKSLNEESQNLKIKLHTNNLRIEEMTKQHENQTAILEETKDILKISEHTLIVETLREIKHEYLDLTDRHETREMEFKAYVQTNANLDKEAQQLRNTIKNQNQEILETQELVEALRHTINTLTLEHAIDTDIIDKIKQSSNQKIETQDLFVYVDKMKSELADCLKVLSSREDDNNRLRRDWEDSKKLRLKLSSDYERLNDEKNQEIETTKKKFQQQISKLNSESQTELEKLRSECQRREDEFQKSLEKMKKTHSEEIKQILEAEQSKAQTVADDYTLVFLKYLAKQISVIESQLKPTTFDPDLRLLIAFHASFTQKSLDLPKHLETINEKYKSMVKETRLSESDALLVSEIIETESFKKYESLFKTHSNLVKTIQYLIGYSEIADIMEFFKHMSTVLGERGFLVLKEFLTGHVITGADLKTVGLILHDLKVFFRVKKMDTLNYQLTGMYKVFNVYGGLNLISQLLNIANRVSFEASKLFERISLITNLGKNVELELTFDLLAEIIHIANKLKKPSIEDLSTAYLNNRIHKYIKDSQLSIKDSENMTLQYLINDYVRTHSATAKRGPEETNEKGGIRKKILRRVDQAAETTTMDI